MKYLLVLIIYLPSQPVSISQIGPFRDIMACEAAAAQTVLFEAKHPQSTVQTFCAAERVWGHK